MALSPSKKTEHINMSISSFNKQDDKIDKLWKREIENRLIAYKEGKLKSIPLEQVLAKHRTNRS
jgi:putative addiction module component (TIGR02574 family)